MRNSCALVLLVLFSWMGGLVQDARGGATVEVVFQDATTPTGITIQPGDPGPGCAFGGYAGGSVSTGYCMDVVLKTSVDWISAGVSAQYEDGNGLAVGSAYEWIGAVVSWSRGTPVKFCSAVSGPVVNPPGFGRTKGIQSFECVVPPPYPPVAPPGTYRVGTIVWDTSGTYWAGDRSVTIAAFIDALIDGFNAVVNGNIIVNYPVTVQSQTLKILPPAVPSMSAAGLAGLGAALLGIGIVALVVAGRRGSIRRRVVR